MTTITPPASARPVSAARPSARFLQDAGVVLVRARAAGSPAECYCLAHLAALRGAAAVLAARARPSRPDAAGTAWDVLGHVAPELGEWALFFAAGVPKRAAAGAGLRGAVTHREADDLILEAESFLGAVSRLLGAQNAGTRNVGARGAGT
jgi:hypothetical protein